MPSSLPGGWTLGGEWAICWNGRLLSTRPSPTVEHHPEGLGSESPQLCPLPTSHLFPASSRFNFGSLHCLLRSLLHHLSPPWSLKNSLAAPWKGLQSVIGTVDQNGRAEGGRMWPCLGGISAPSFYVMAHLPAGSALWLAARWEARHCKKGAQYP